MSLNTNRIRERNEMAEVGRRPSQFNPIEKERDNTDDLMRTIAALKFRRQYKPSDFVTQTLPQDATTVPPMPIPLGAGGL